MIVIVRPVDGNGDMMPVSSSDQMISGAPAVAQIVRDRLTFMYGEWWEDETLGFRVPQFLIQGVRRGNTGMLEQYISQYIAGTTGVAKISNIDTKYDNHRLSYSCTVTAGNGSGNEEVEVDLSGLL